LAPKKIEMVGKLFFVYIMTNKNSTVLYAGVTSNLRKRAFEHKEKMVKGFTHKHNVDKLLYYEVHSDSCKGISRPNKIGLIGGINETWKGLYYEL